MDSIKHEPMVGCSSEEYIVPDILQPPSEFDNNKMTYKIEIDTDTNLGNWPTLEVLPGFRIKDVKKEEEEETTENIDLEIQSPVEVNEPDSRISNPDSVLGSWPTLEVLPGLVINEAEKNEVVIEVDKEEEQQEEVEKMESDDDDDNNDDDNSDVNNEEEDEVCIVSDEECGEDVDLCYISESRKKRLGKFLLACAKCEQPFMYGSSLSKHVKWHIIQEKSTYDKEKQAAILSEISKMEKQKPKTPENMYACAKCPKKFNYMLSLSKHLQWHRGEDLKKKKTVEDVETKQPETAGKFYACGNCRQKFSDIVALLRHVKKMVKHVKKVEAIQPVIKEENVVKIRKYTKVMHSPKVHEKKQKALLSDILKLEKGVRCPQKNFACAICHHKFDHMLSLTKHIRWHKLEEEKNKTERRNKEYIKADYAEFKLHQRMIMAKKTEQSHKKVVNQT